MKSDLFRGRCLFHVHTNWTDGRPTVDQWCRLARHAGASSIVFLEHIRRKPTYDPQQFADEVRRCAADAGLHAAVGFEARLLPDGSLDIDDDHARLADVLGLAEHAFPGGLDDYAAAFARALERCASLAQSRPVVWVHPGLLLKKWNLLLAEHARYETMLRQAQRHGLLIERNLRHDLVPRDFLHAVADDALVIGLDAHDPDDLSRWSPAAPASA